MIRTKTLALERLAMARITRLRVMLGNYPQSEAKAPTLLTNNTESSRTNTSAYFEVESMTRK